MAVTAIPGAIAAKGDKPGPAVLADFRKAAKPGPDMHKPDRNAALPPFPGSFSDTYPEPDMPKEDSGVHPLYPHIRRTAMENTEP